MASASEDEAENTEQSIEGNVDVSNELLFLADELVLYPEILEKSQVPKTKKIKDEAIKMVIKKYYLKFGKIIDIKVFMKKINNMKSRLKKKTDTHENGNKKIVLLEWEKKMLVALKGGSNRVVSCIPGAIQCGAKRRADGKTRSGTPIPPLSPGASNTHNLKSSPTLPPLKKTALDQYETEVTKKLTTKELQRLVLLQQLKTAEVQEEYFKQKLHLLRENRTENYSNNDEIVKYEDCSLY